MAAANKRIEDYALIGDCRSAALVARDGAIDWLCWPRFDSDACFAALLGDERHGSWRIAPSEAAQSKRRYLGDTLILETRHATASGTARVVDLMPVGAAHRTIIRQVAGEQGRVAMSLDLALRFDYGRIAPWLAAAPRRVTAVIGPDLVLLQSPVALNCSHDRVHADFAVKAGETIDFVLQYGLSYEPEPAGVEVAAAIAGTRAYWQKWADRFTAPTDWPAVVKRSLLTLRALTDAGSGGMIAAPTASLPEIPGGAANWDYRYTWLRDATFGATALLNAGYRDEARAWRNWLLRAAAGAPEHLRTMYRHDGARQVEPRDISWLPGFERSAPVHVGNPAAAQFQLDNYGDVLDTLHLCAQVGLDGRPWDIAVEEAVAAFIEKVWRHPDQGIWESRGPPRHSTYSKAMAWVGIDRFLKLGRGDDPFRQRLARLHDEIRREVCREGYSAARNSFVDAFGSDVIDASLLLLPLIGFLPADDPRMAATITAIERELVEDGLVRRHPRSEGPAEGAFLPCTCWLADCLAMQGRQTEARAYFERFLECCNDVGLLPEEWDTGERRALGNFPQALSHIALINTALGLCGPVLRRGGG